MKKLALPFSFVFVLLSFSTFAQKNFKPATVILVSGETLNGELDYQNWESNPSRFLFRADATSSSKMYDIQTVESFTVGDDTYKRAIVAIDKRFDDISRLSDDYRIQTHTDTLFLQALVTGPKSLYYYRDNVDHFFIEKSSGFELLRFKKYVVKVAETGFAKAVSLNKEYIPQLHEYLGDCSSIGNRLERSTYSFSSLRNIFTSYYNCKAIAPQYAARQDKQKIDVGVVAGAVNTKINFSSETNTIISRIDYPSSLTFTGGVFADIVLSRRRGRLSINNELIYTDFETNGSYRSSTSPTRYDEETYNFGFAYIKMNNMLRYKFFLDKTSIFINTGFTNGIAIKETNTRTKLHKVDDMEVKYEYIGHGNVRKHELGFLAGAGIKRNRTALELRAERGNGFLEFTDAKVATLRFMALLSVRLM